MITIQYFVHDRIVAQTRQTSRAGAAGAVWGFLANAGMERFTGIRVVSPTLLFHAVVTPAGLAVVDAEGFGHDRRSVVTVGRIDYRRCDDGVFRAPLSPADRFSAKLPGEIDPNFIAD